MRCDAGLHRRRYWQPTLRSVFFLATAATVSCAAAGREPAPAPSPVVGVPSATAEVSDDPTPASPPARPRHDLERGKTIYSKRCTPCHGAHAEGRIGPNLTDTCFLHGSGVESILEAVTDGVPHKGMVAWRTQLSQDELVAVARYIHSLAGTDAPGGRECQGEVQ